MLKREPQFKEPKLGELKYAEKNILWYNIRKLNDVCARKGDDFQLGYNAKKYTHQDLLMRQAYPPEVKLALTKRLISEFHDHYPISISYSGGKQSHILAHIIRKMYPDTPLVFANTGLEFPELQKDARENGAVFVNPVLRHREVIQKFGYPIGSKKICETVHKLRHQNRSARYRNYLLNGDERGNFGMLPKRWRCLLDAPFEVSDKCCYYMKKKPLQDYLKQTGRYPIIGILAQESDDRAKSWETHGCNVLEGHHPQSWPLALWTEKDCDDYIREFEIQLPALYQMGYKRTGCMFCMFGILYDGYPNRFQIMAQTHRKQYDYCVGDFDKGGLGFGFVSDYVGIEYRPNIRQDGQVVLFN